MVDYIMTDRSVILVGGVKMPRIVDKEQKKKQIALLALDIFADHGFEGASVSQIAEAAGIGKGTVYEYFESKEDLAFAAIHAWMEEMEKGAEELLGSIDDPVERLRRYVDAAMEAFVGDPRTVRLSVAIFQMLIAGSWLDPRRNLIREMFAGMRKSLVSILLEGVSRGIFRPEVARAAETIAINLIAYLDGIGLHYLMSAREFDLREQVRFVLDRMLAGLAPAATDSEEGGS
jgi:AcrR family transcriptional regulator